MQLKDKQMLEQISNLKNEKGDYCDFGCSEKSIDRMIAQAKKLFPKKPCRVVSRWCWADVEIDPQHALEIREAGLQPCFIYANNILYDERDPFAAGMTVRTTLLVDFRNQCIFSSQNTNYILCGSGVRLTVLPQVYNDTSWIGVDGHLK